jgi:hypothetical protein
MVDRRPFSFNFIFGNKKSQGANQGSMVNDSHFVSRQKLLGEDGSVRRGVVMVKQSNLFRPNFGATCLHVFTQSPQKVALEPGIRSLTRWDRCFALLQLLYRWRHQSGIFWISPRTLGSLYVRFKSRELGRGIFIPFLIWLSIIEYSWKWQSHEIVWHPPYSLVTGKTLCTMRQTYRFVDWQALTKSFNLEIAVAIRFSFVGAFAKLRQATVSFIVSVGQSHGTTQLPLDGFSLNFIIWVFFWNVSRKNQVPLKPEKNKGYFTWRVTCMYDNI